MGAGTSRCRRRTSGLGASLAGRSRGPPTGSSGRGRGCRVCNEPGKLVTTADREVTPWQSGFSPEDDVRLRLARLCILLDVVEDLDKSSVSIERLGYYDFLATSPFLVFQDSPAERRELLFAGFEPNSLSYASASQRLTLRRERITADVTLLISYGIASFPARNTTMSPRLTALGHEISRSLKSSYGKSYRRAVTLIVRRLSRLSDARLRASVKGWTSLRGESSAGVSQNNSLRLATIVADAVRGVAATSSQGDL